MPESTQHESTQHESTQQAQAQSLQSRVDEAPVVRTEPPLTLIDAGVLALILALALWFLYRQLWRKRGACGGCAKGAGGGCAVARSNARTSAPVQPPQISRVPVESLRKRSR